MTTVTAILETDKGTIRLNLFPDEAPVTVSNFINLVSRDYYNGLTFHRVIDSFMIQGGCPQGSGTGGPGYQFEDECDSDHTHDKPGMLSMANAGPGTNGSQFFITHEATPWLDGKHTIFGAVVDSSDQAVINQIEQGDLIKTVSIEGDIDLVLKPCEEKLIYWNSILDVEFPSLKSVTANS